MINTIEPFSLKIDHSGRKGTEELTAVLKEKN